MSRVSFLTTLRLPVFTDVQLLMPLIYGLAFVIDGNFSLRNRADGMWPSGLLFFFFFLFDTVAHRDLDPAPSPLSLSVSAVYF